MDVCGTIAIKLNKTFDDRLDFCSKVLIFLGFTHKDFKMGNNMIFFRSEKLEMLKSIFSEAIAARRSEEYESDKQLKTRKPK